MTKLSEKEALKRVRDNMRDLKRKKGKYYEYWKNGRLNRK